MSDISFRNDEDPLHTGQGMLQGSSSAAPVYNINSDVLNKLSRISEKTKGGLTQRLPGA